MKVIRDTESARLERSQCSHVAFVPTMGAFHEGHLELMRQAAQHSENVWISIYVNPLQFGVGEDYERYPRNEDRDLQLAESVGVKVAFCPTESFVSGIQTTVSIPELANVWEGTIRPQHFDGVATIVSRLFGVIQPNLAFFGQKDLQQCAVIRALVRDLAYPLELRFIETIREEDGLAMSSRNAYLDPVDRLKATKLVQALRLLRDSIQAGIPYPNAQKDASQLLKDSGFSVDYIAMVDALTMREISIPTVEARVIVAARLKNIRLIDNLPM